MRCVYWISTRDYEEKLIVAVREGAAKHGDTVEGRYLGEWEHGADTGEVMILTGMHASRIAPISDSLERGIRILHLDKGISREPATKSNDMKTQYWRMGIDEHQPVRLLPKMPIMPSDRRHSHNWTFDSWQANIGGHVLICPPGKRECVWYNIGNHVTYAAQLAKTIHRAYHSAELYFRPKPRHAQQHQWEDAPPGTVWDNINQPIEVSLLGARAMVAFSTSATLNSILRGIPIHVMGPNWAHRLATPLPVKGIAVQRLPDRKTVEAELNRLAYLQWTWDEWRSGQAWDFVKQALKYPIGEVE